jgi:hypothetical protein
MNEGGVLIANLSKGKLGSTGSHLLAALLATTIAQVAEERASIPLEDRRNFTLYADEVQNIATTSFASVLSEARNFRLALVLAHQFLSQLPFDVRESVIGNCGTSVVFRVGAEDARKLAAELDIENHATLASTPNYQCWVKLLQGGAPTDAFLMDTTPVEPPVTGRKPAVVAHTQARHTRMRAAVERRILAQVRS